MERVATFISYQKQSAAINPTEGNDSVYGTTEVQNEPTKIPDLTDEDVDEHKVDVEGKMDSGGTVDSLSPLNRNIPELPANPASPEDAAPAMPAASVDPDVATEEAHLL